MRTTLRWMLAALAVATLCGCQTQGDAYSQGAAPSFHGYHGYAWPHAADDHREFDRLCR